jgi:lipopolysaccharide transport system ATP-binding protein
MSDFIIKAEGVGKKYIITHEQAGSYSALRDVISNRAKKLIKKEKESAEREEFWALKNVSFEIKKGEVVGIIGRNGAGKSTLLKILSRITEPSTGRIELNGRVASLLEVGTGFHPELTGRENIYLNGAILGMGRIEIRRKFDEIVDFSGVEKFLDTPVKRYSSGMYVRLAFAVAAHLEPEILVIDEVLAVGDAEFQKKCLGKMDEVSKKEGRTVLFVSHDLSAISTLTSKSIFLEKGSIRCMDNTNVVISQYTSKQEQGNIYETAPDLTKPTVTRVELQTSEKGMIHSFGEPLSVRFEVNIPNERMEHMALSVQVMNHLNYPVLYNWIFDLEQPIFRTQGRHTITLQFRNLRTYKGNYFIRVHLAETRTKQKFQQFDCCSFEVVMLNRKEPEWGWQNNVCQYFDDASWLIDGQLVKNQSFEQL